MYTRLLKPPDKSFFLFGPRGTGKSTWLKKTFPQAERIDLLPPKNALAYQKDPDLLTRTVLTLPKDRWVVLDEVQRVPSLLDAVHDLMENHGHKRFVLTGSSARKLKKGAANLLAGRAIVRKFYPLNSKELEFGFDIDQILRYGLLPLSINAASNREREDYLTSYVMTYLQEEIKAEGLTRQIGAFSRFLEIASLVAAQKVNVSGLSRDAGIGRDTVRGYFDIFEDTLLGSWLPAFKPRSKIKEVALPKFYWFDTGVLNACAGYFSQPMPSDWIGVLLEHLVHHELKSYMDYREKKGSLGYWATPSKAEIDFLWWHGTDLVAIEVKASKKFKSEFLSGIRSLSEGKKLRSSWIVYLGDRELRDGPTRILPYRQFVEELHSGKII